MPRVDGWTYGAEHELADWDSRLGLPQGFARSPDYTIVNSNIIAAQPNPKVYPFGGEINTPPTTTPQGQADCLGMILERHPDCTVNHRSNLHVHVRVPGLKNDLGLLKQIQKYIHSELPAVLNLVEPIPIGQTPAEKKRERRRRVSHHTLLTPKRLSYQLAASTTKEFFEREVPCSKAGKVMWHAQPRLAVGLRQLLQTDTIEFRHFPGTLDVVELATCVHWCREFVLYAIRGQPLLQLWEKYASAPFPAFPLFDEEVEIGYQATASHNGLSQTQIKQNIQLILQGEFYASSAYQEASERAGCLPRKHLS